MTVDEPTGFALKKVVAHGPDRLTRLPGLGETSRPLLRVWVVRAPRRCRLGELFQRERRTCHSEPDSPVLLLYRLFTVRQCAVYKNEIQRWPPWNKTFYPPKKKTKGNQVKNSKPMPERSLRCVPTLSTAVVVLAPSFSVRFPLPSTLELYWGTSRFHLHAISVGLPPPPLPPGSTTMEHNNRARWSHYLYLHPSGIYSTYRLTIFLAIFSRMSVIPSQIYWYQASQISGFDAHVPYQACY